MGRRSWLSCAAGALAGAACSRASGGANPNRVRVWAHQGQESENRAVRAIARAFERAHAGVSIELSFFPDFHYTEKLSIAAAARDMPDAFELDGPLVASFVDAGLLASILPSPRKWSPIDPTDYIQNRARTAMARAQILSGHVTCTGIRG